MPVLTQDNINTQPNTAKRPLRMRAELVNIRQAQHATNGRHKYRINVKQRGCHVASYIVKAADALTAISMIEPLYGRPLSLVDGAIEDKDGTRHHIMVANNWYGYTFSAEKV